ncbi:ASI1-immunoprecipitated protein 2-like protein [Drosera capensis]
MDESDEEEMSHEMERLETGFSVQPPLKMEKNWRNVNLTTSTAYSSQSSFSSAATSDHSVAKNLEHTPLDYRGDVISCIIEGSGPDRIVGGFVDEADKKTLSCSSASVDSSFPVMDIQSAYMFQGSGQCMVKVSEICSTPPPIYSNEAMELAEELPERSDPSETSSYRTGQPGSLSIKVAMQHQELVSLLLVIVNVLMSPHSFSYQNEHGNFIMEEVDTPLSGPIDGQKSDLGTSVHPVGTSMEKNDRNHYEPETLKSSKTSEHSEFIQASKEDHCLPSQAVEDDDSSEELVDVRVCDICGDVGREELLAVCSRCGDGAEHIYCMRVKLDKPPEGNWMCEECVTSEEQMQSGAAAGKSAGSPKVSPLGKEQPGSGEMGFAIQDSGNRKQPSTKRSGSNLQSSSVKRRFFHRSLSTIMTKRDLQETAALMKLNSSEYPPLSALVSQKSGAEGRKVPHFSNKFLHDGLQVSGWPSLKRSYTMTANTSLPTSPRSRLGIARIEGKKRPAFLGNTTFKREIMPKASANGKKMTGVETRKVPGTAGCFDHKASNPGHISAAVASRHSTPSGRVNGPVGTVGSSGAIKAKRSCNDILTAASSHFKKADNVRMETTRPVERMCPSVVIPSSVYPEPDRIWRGVFKCEKGGKVPRYCDGIQAHLSSCASPKVPEVVLKFPLEIHLSGIPRVDAWPIQLQKNGASDDHIALYFFAEDHYSYHRSYAGLLECMIFNDLALVADLDGIELLIFPSSVLPQSRQRWNNLLYLWGVFRGKVRSQYNVPASSCAKTDIISNMNAEATQDYSSSLKPLMGGTVSCCGAFHQPIQVKDLASAGIVACASTSRELGVSQAQEVAFSAKVDGSITTAAEVLLPSNSVKQLQILGNMEPSENLQREDACRMKSHTGRDVVCGTTLLDRSNVGECSQNGNLSTENFSSQSGHVDDPHGELYPMMIDPSSIERTGGVKGSMISFIPLVSDPSLTDSIDPFDSDEGQTDPMDLELSLGSMTKKPMKRGNLISFFAASNGDDFRFRQHDVYVNLSL